jgi:hypothetical protein
VNATPNAPARQRKPRVKPVRTIRLVVPLNAEGDNGVVRIVVGKESADYFLARIPADFGAAYQLQKIGEEDATPYHVNLNGRQSTCECKGFTRWNRCKHTDGLAALTAAGRL